MTDFSTTSVRLRYANNFGTPIGESLYRSTFCGTSSVLGHFSVLQYSIPALRADP